MPSTIMFGITALLLGFLLILLTGCAPASVNLAKYSPPGEQELSVVMVENVDYDDHSRPVFHKKLSKRPSEAGEQFTLVYYLKNKPVKSFDIAITEQGPNMKRPLEVIYKWTGEGFQLGVASAKSVVQSQSKNGDPGSLQGTEAYAAITPVVVLSVGGFVIGVVSSIPVTVQELYHLFLNKKETLISYTIYEYDERERLKEMRMYLPTDAPAEVVRTDFFYTNEDTVPYKTEIMSYPENKLRTIQ